MDITFEKSKKHSPIKKNNEEEIKSRASKRHAKEKEKLKPCVYMVQTKRYKYELMIETPNRPQYGPDPYEIELGTLVEVKN